MNCPKCNRENDHDAQICSACGSDLLQASGPPQRPDVKISELAVASCTFGLLAVVSFLLAVRLPTSVRIFVLPSIISAILALVLGIVGLVCIEKSYGRLTGKGFAAIGITIPVAAFFLVGGYTALTRPRCVAYRLYCGTNLSGIGKAMLIYSNDYDDELPRAAGLNSKWGTTPNWQGVTAAEAYGLKDGPGQATISANFYLLVKYAEVTPKSFICIHDKKTTEFTLAKYKIRDKDMVDLWDFGPDPSKHCSYTYHLPYGKYPLSASSDPGLAVAGDRNPWLASPSRNARSAKDFQAFDPNGTRESTKRGNAFEHQDDGQNVLFVDGHTSFEKTSACGVDGDNIYTSHNGTDIRRGTPPTLTSQPANKADSLLVHDPPEGAEE